MAPIIGIIAFLTVLALSLILTRVATVALTMTGLSEEVAKFQARSAFTGTGFTTKEAENVVNHPVRRKIIGMLMIIRSAGLVTIILSLILSLTGYPKGIQVLMRMAWLAEQALMECKLRDEGISVLGIVRENGDYVGVPKGSTKLHGGDTAILYGRVDDLHALDKRHLRKSGS